ncbi:MAG TPA: porin [Sideroxyarcus sp.]|nr:porin [Sideroxyarcus sp.]
MQKKIIALAVAAAFSAPALADTTVYGIIDAAVANVSATGQKSDLLVVSGGQSGSRLGFKGAEEISGDLKVVYQLEYALDTQTNTTLASARQQMLGVAGGFGTVATGYLQTAGYDWAVKFDPLAGSLVSPLQVVNQTNFLIGATAIAKRAPRALAYISPNLGGVTVAVNYSSSFDNALGNLTLADNATAGLKTTAMLASVTYAAGPLAVGGVLAKTSDATSTGAATASGKATTYSDYSLGASFDLSVVKLFATYQSTKHTDPATAAAIEGGKAYSFTGVIPVGADGAVGVAYAKNSLTNKAANAGQNHNGSSFLVGYLHNLSSTTNAYVAFQSAKNGANTSAYSVDNNALAGSTAPNWVSGGGSSRLIAVGMRKKF